MKTTISLFLLLLLLFGCRKDNLCGNESFCAEVNGKKWWPSDNGDFKARPLTASLLYGDSVLAIRASNGYERIYLSSRGGGIISAKNYALTDTLSRGYFDKSIASDEFATDAAHTGFLTITEIDRVKETVVGSFHFKAKNPISGEVVDVANGSFNVRYNKY